MAAPIRIANCSGFYGDRLAAAREMVEGGPIDVLTGDWLAELTMLILHKDRARNPRGGYARTFVTQVEQVLGTCLERGIRIVANAGGLNPSGCAAAVREVADRLGLHPSIAWVGGDDLIPRWAELRTSGHAFENLDTGAPLGEREVLTANAYLGCWGIVEALQRGADVVVTGRTTDAAVVLGPAAWHHGWARNDWDRLAGGIVAGHLIECGPQVTGGNYAFFSEVPDLSHLGFPIAEVADDGSSVITKHDGHAGLVSVGTVTAQLLYEIGGVAYANPDAVARFDTVALAQEGPDRVLVSGVRGEPAPATAKVCINLAGAWKTTTTLLLTGLDIEAKAAAVESALWPSFERGRNTFDAVDVQLIRSDHEDPDSNEAATAQLRITVKSADERLVGRHFTRAVTELALASYPGLYGGPGSGPTAYGVYWPALVPAELVPQIVVVDDGEPVLVEPTPPGEPDRDPVQRDLGPAGDPLRPGVGPTERVPLGRVAGARSGDKGGSANVGVWARSPAAYPWLRDHLTVERLQELLPETRLLSVERHELPNVAALNFVVRGLLGEGVASSVRQDAQAKSLGEYLRAKHVDVPVALLGGS